MPKEKEKEKEHVIKAPKVQVTSSPKSKLKFSSSMMRREKTVVFKLARRIGPLFSGLALICGLAVICLVTYIYWTGQMIEFLEVKPVVTASLLVLGVVNLICGLFLMGKYGEKSRSISS